MATTDALTPIIVNRFKEGDHVVFHWTGHRKLYLTVGFVDDKFVYLRQPFAHQTNEYRASLRTNQLRYFDKLGWTLLEGQFDSHIPVYKAPQ